MTVCDSAKFGVVVLLLLPASLPDSVLAVCVCVSFLIVVQFFWLGVIVTVVLNRTQASALITNRGTFKRSLTTLFFTRSLSRRLISIGEVFFRVKPFTLASTRRKRYIISDE